MNDNKAMVEQASKMNQVVLKLEDVQYIKKHYTALKNKWGIGGINYEVYSIK